MLVWFFSLPVGGLQSAPLWHMQFSYTRLANLTYWLARPSQVDVLHLCTQYTLFI